MKKFLKSPMPVILIIFVSALILLAVFGGLVGRIRIKNMQESAAEDSYYFDSDTQKTTDQEVPEKENHVPNDTYDTAVRSSGCVDDIYPAVDWFYRNEKEGYCGETFVSTDSYMSPKIPHILTDANKRIMELEDNWSRVKLDAESASEILKILGSDDGVFTRITKLEKQMSLLQKSLNEEDRCNCTPLGVHQWDMDFVEGERNGQSFDKASEWTYIYADGCRAAFSPYYGGWHYDYRDKHVVNGEVIE